MPTLHPQIVQVLEAMAKAELRPIEEMTPAEARAQMEATARARKAEPLPVAKVEERLIPGPGGEIRLRLYWSRCGGAGAVPAIVYYHGGGHVIGSLDTHDLIARNLCAGAGALVASVDYRMGPEHKFPAAVDDSLCRTAMGARECREPRRRPGPYWRARRQRRRQSRCGRGTDGARCRRPETAVAVAGLPGRRLHTVRRQL